MNITVEYLQSHIDAVHNKIVELREEREPSTNYDKAITAKIFYLIGIGLAIESSIAALQDDPDYKIEYLLLTDNTAIIDHCIYSKKDLFNWYDEDRSYYKGEMIFNLTHHFLRSTWNEQNYLWRLHAEDYTRVGSYSLEEARKYIRILRNVFHYPY